MKCDHEALRKDGEIKDVEWKVNGFFRRWTRVAYCNGSLACRVTKSEVANGIKVLEISNGALTIKRTSRNATTSHMDFKCEIHTRSQPHTHEVKINLAVECKSNSVCPRFLGPGGAIQLGMFSSARFDFYFKQGDGTD